MHEGHPVSTVSQIYHDQIYSTYTVSSPVFVPFFSQDALNMLCSYTVSLYMCIYMPPEHNLGSTHFGEQTSSLSSLVPEPWVGTQHCHMVATQVCPVSSVCSLGHRWIPAQKNGGSLCPFFTLISVSSNTWHIKSHAFGLHEWCRDTKTSITTALL